MSEDSPTRYSKEWIREEWDYENDTARKSVQLVKLVHEWHIALPGVVVGAVVSIVGWQVSLSPVQAFGVFATFAAGGYKLLYPEWWCSTLAE
jgi:hypothetical protein